MAERTMSEMRDRLAVLAPLELAIDDESACMSAMPARRAAAAITG